VPLPLKLAMSYPTRDSSPSEATNNDEFVKIDRKTYYRVP
jgi:hypothetical protein